MLCPVCAQDIDGASHGACWRATYDRLIARIAEQQRENDGLRDRLFDAGAMRRGEK